MSEVNSLKNRSSSQTLTALALYLLFALVATLVNFSTQEAMLFLLPRAPLMLPILAGTATGFVAKYLLDKFWVFQDGYRTKSEELRKVGLYGLFSVGTTVVFWAFELTAWLIWQTDTAKYAGGALGLAIGYAAKFVLDRRYVFRTERA